MLVKTKFKCVEEALTFYEENSKHKEIIADYPINYYGVVNSINDKQYFLTIIALRKKFLFSKVERIGVVAGLHPDLDTKIKKGDLVSWHCLDNHSLLPGLEGYGWIEYKHKLEFDHDDFQFTIDD
jgi:hypothetical protein